MIWDTIMVTVLWVLGGIFVLSIGVFVYFMSRYKHKVEIRELVHGRKVIHDDKAKIFKDRDGNEWWKLLKFKQKLPRPPEQAIELTSKGKKKAAWYKTEDGQFLPQVDEVDEDNYKEKLKTFKDKNAVRGKEDHEGISAFKPFTTTQRALLVSELKDARERRGKSWKENLPNLFAMGAFVIIIFGFLIFGPDLLNSYKEVTTTTSEQMQSLMEERTLQLELWNQMKSDIQAIKQEVGLPRGNLTGAPD